MKKIYYLFVLGMCLLSCNETTSTQFTKEALKDTFVTLNGDHITFNTILNENKGKTILIDIWASWCQDCIKSIPKVKMFQAGNKDVVYVFLSLDKTEEAWRKGVKKYNINGNHYFMLSGWEGAFGSFAKLDWIPRFLVVNKQGKIDLFKAVTVDDDKLIQAIKK